LFGWTAAEQQRYSLDDGTQEEAHAPGARKAAQRASGRVACARCSADTTRTFSPAPRAEPAPATAAAARPAERTPPAPQGADLEPEEAPVAARTRNSPLRLAEEAHAQEDAAAEGDLVATTKAVKLLSAEELVRKRASGFSLPLGRPHAGRRAAVRALV